MKANIARQCKKPLDGLAQLRAARPEKARPQSVAGHRKGFLKEMGLRFREAEGRREVWQQTSKSREAGLRMLRNGGVYAVVKGQGLRCPNKKGRG